MSPNDDTQFMRRALALAEQGLSEDEMPIGAVAVLDGEVISSAYWRFRQDALLDHAEVVALRGAERDSRVRGRRRQDVTLYSTLEPCLLCMGAAMSFHAGRIVFALEAPIDGASNVADVWQPALGRHPPPGFRVYGVPTVVGGVCRAESLVLMQTYAEQHPDQQWARAFLPGFSYTTEAS